jgi:hypothetical protein
LTLRAFFFAALTHFKLTKITYSQSAQLCPIFEPIFPQNGPICASFRKKSVFIEKFLHLFKKM